MIVAIKSCFRNQKYRIVFYWAALCCVCCATILLVLSPSDIKRLLFGPSENDLAILRFHIESQFEATGDSIKVLLPANYDPNQKYDVLYILPVTSAFLDQWWHNGIIVAAQQEIADQYGVICVYPEFKATPWYADNPNNQKIKQESFLIRAVVPFVDQQFSTLPSPEGRYLLGFSKSGFGAFAMLLRHPDVFLKAAAWDAPMLFEDLDVQGSHLRKIFGTDTNYASYYIPELLQKNAGLFAERSHQLVLMGHSYLKKDIEQLHQFMNKFGIAHVYDNATKRKHRWDSGWLPEAVKILLKEKNVQY